MKPKVDSLRRDSDTETKAFSLTLPVDVVELLESYGVKSQRGGGNLSAYLTISSLVTLGLFDNPELCVNNLTRLFNPASNDIYVIAENLEEVAKRLLDLLE